MVQSIKKNKLCILQILHN